MLNPSPLLRERKKGGGGESEFNIPISVYSYSFPSIYPGAAGLCLFSSNCSLQCFCLRVQSLIPPTGACLCVHGQAL